MSKSKKSGKRQAVVLEDLFAGEGDEQEILAKHNIDQDTYGRWLADPHFAALLAQRIARARHEARLILARYAPRAATRLVELTKSGKEEIARQACLDIIGLHPPADPVQTPDQPSAGRPAGPAPELSAELASRLLAALAREAQPNDAAPGPA